MLTHIDHVGLPEAQYALAQATTYIATAPKSNRAGLGFFAAAGDVEAKGSLPVPLHLRNAGHRAMKQRGIGVGYRYPHEYEDGDVAQQYLPDELAERRYYLPTDQGYEATIAARQDARAVGRAAAKSAGRTPPNPNPAPEVGRATRCGHARRAGRSWPRPRSATRTTARRSPIRAGGCGRPPCRRRGVNSATG